MASVALSSIAATAIDDGLDAVRLNLGDTDASPEAFPVGQPFIREAVVADRQTAAQVQAAIGASSIRASTRRRSSDAIADKGNVVRFVS